MNNNRKPRSGLDLMADCVIENDNSSSTFQQNIISTSKKLAFNATSDKFHCYGTEIDLSKSSQPIQLSQLSNISDFSTQDNLRGLSQDNSMNISDVFSDCLTQESSKYEISCNNEDMCNNSSQDCNIDNPSIRNCLPIRQSKKHVTTSKKQYSKDEFIFRMKGFKDQDNTTHLFLKPGQGTLYQWEHPPRRYLYIKILKPLLTDYSTITTKLSQVSNYYDLIMMKYKIISGSNINPMFYQYDKRSEMYCQLSNKDINDYFCSMFQKMNRLKVIIKCYEKSLTGKNNIQQHILSSSNDMVYKKSKNLKHMIDSNGYVILDSISYGPTYHKCKQHNHLSILLSGNKFNGLVDDKYMNWQPMEYDNYEAYDNKLKHMYSSNVSVDIIMSLQQDIIHYMNKLDIKTDSIHINAIMEICLEGYDQMLYHFNNDTGYIVLYPFFPSDRKYEICVLNVSFYDNAYLTFFN